MGEPNDVSDDLYESLIEYDKRIEQVTMHVSEQIFSYIHNWEQNQITNNWLDICSLSDDIVIIPYIPKGVKRLSIRCRSKFLQSIPDSVREFYYSENNHRLPSLPDGLRKLQCHVDTVILPDKFPTNLHTLEISSTIIGHTPQLPNSLRRLIVKYDSIEPPNLPVGLLYLKYYMTKCHIPRGLPPGLIQFECNKTYINNLPVLPQTLKVLSCSENKLTVLPSLPDGLQVLSCYDNQLECLPELPTSLKVLNCSFNRLTSLPPLPEGLVRLICCNNNITHLPLLPSSLKEIIIQNE
jgi:Leucine-rich repeat (LRR) protein